jgi:hypothetical protein
MPKMKSGYEYVLSMGDELGKYVDEWIGVVDNRVVARGKDAQTVYAETKKSYPDEIPFIMKVPTDKVMVL